jgi:hypothetical protein
MASVQKSLVHEANYYRIKFAEQEKIKQIQLDEIKKQKQEEIEQQRLDEIKKRQEEDKRNTRHYYNIDKFDRKIRADGSPFYLGGLESKSQAWRPHGRGKFVVEENILTEGLFKRGTFIEGKINFSNDQVWKGSIKKNAMYGAGELREVEREEPKVIMRNSAVICSFEGNIDNWMDF